jgi:hypothetical protein
LEHFASGQFHERAGILGAMDAAEQVFGECMAELIIDILF